MSRLIQKRAIVKVSYVKHCPGHKNSKGESAPWCVCSHKDGRIISSHATRAEAKKHLEMMEMYKHKGGSAKPLASPGFLSFRYRGPYGWIMIGARDVKDALRQAALSTDAPVHLGNLEEWNGEQYLKVSNTAN